MQIPLSEGNRITPEKNTSPHLITSPIIEFRLFSVSDGVQEAIAFPDLFISYPLFETVISQLYKVYRYMLFCRKLYNLFYFCNRKTGTFGN